MNNLQNFIETIGNGSVATTGKASKLLNNLSQTSETIVDSTASVVSNLSSTAGGATKGLVSSATNVFGKGVGVASNVVGDLSGTASTVTKGLVGAAGDTVEKIVDSSANVLTDASNTLKFIVTDSLDTAGNIKNRLNDLLNDIINPDKLLANPLVYCVIIVVLSMYGPRLSPKLPAGVKDLFNNNIFRFVVIVLVAYLSNRNLQASILIAAGFALLLSVANNQAVEEEFDEHFNNNYSNYDTIREI